MSEKSIKKNNTNIFLIVLVVILLILLCISVIWIVTNTNTSSSSKNNSTTTSKTVQSNSTVSTSSSTDNENNIISFDSSKSLNSSESSYTLSCQGNAGIWVTVNSTQKELTFSYTPSRVVQYYSLNWTSSRTDLNSDVIKFDKKIIDLYFGGMGQDSSHDTLFILLEDGTVEYIPIVKMFNTAQGAAISYGKIDGVSNVTKFVLSSTTGGVTTLALKSDGSFYDMWYALEDTGNY